MSVAPEKEQSVDLTPLVAELREAVGDEWVYTQAHQLRTYESDGLLQYKGIPAAAVLPGTAEEVQAVVRACASAGVPFVARGAGSGLSGGALPISDGILIVLSRMKRVLDVDLENHRVCVEPGVTNVEVTAAVAPDFFYPPDPSSQIVCSIGGNLAENSGGVLGKMISPQNLAIGAAAVGLAGKEGDIFRRVLFWSIGLALVMCVIVYLQSTAILDWMVVEAK